MTTRIFFFCKKCSKNMMEFKNLVDEDKGHTIICRIKPSFFTWKKFWAFFYSSIKALGTIYMWGSVIVMTTTLLTIQHIPDGLNQIVIKY